MTNLAFVLRRHTTRYRRPDMHAGALFALFVVGLALGLAVGW